MNDIDKSRKAANEQLMPCPFCGERAHIVQHVFITCGETYGVKCDSCNAQGYQFYRTMGEAVAAWNTRKEAAADVKPVVRGEWVERIDEYPDRNVANVGRKTYAEDFLQAHPNAKQGDGYPIICRNDVYTKHPRKICKGQCKACWNEEMEANDD